MAEPNRKSRPALPKAAHRSASPSTTVTPELQHRRGRAEKGYNPCWCERIYLGRVAQKSLECSPGNSALAWIAVEPEPVADRQQERDPQCRAASQRKKIEGTRSSLLRGLQLEDGLATRSAQDAAKCFGCCHHGAILRVGGGRNLASEMATARPTVLDNFMGVSFAARAARRNGFNLNLSSRMGSSVPSRSCPPRTPRGAWPASSCRHWR